MFELLEKIMNIKNISLNDLTANTSVSQQQFSNWKTKSPSHPQRHLKNLQIILTSPFNIFYWQANRRERKLYR